MKIKLVSILTIIVILIIFTTNYSIAVTQDELEAEQRKVNNQIDNLEDEKDKVEANKKSTLNEISSLNDKITAYEDEIDNLDTQLSQLNSSIKEAETKINQATEEYNKQSKLLDTRLITMYQAGQTTYLDMILTSKDLSEFISSYHLISILTESDLSLMQKIQKQKEEIEAAKQQIETNKQQVETVKSNKENVADNLKSTKSEKDKYVAQLTEDEKKLQDEIDELKNHENEVKNQIKKMQEEYDKQHSSSNSGGAASSYGFGWPVANHTIGTRYGVAGSYWSSGYHTGVDFPVKTGTPVYAVGDGQVFDTGYNSAYGNFVEIYHGNNIYSFYAHASSVQVKVGTQVKKGQQIMLSGATGNVSGPHLHFEIRTPGYRYSNCVNPMPYLPS